MASFSGEVSAWFWNPNVWLPPNVTWKDIESSENVKYANFDDLLYPIPIAFVLILIRLALDRCVFTPFGSSLGLKNKKPKKAAPVPLLEKAYSNSTKIDYKKVQGLARKLDWTERQVERWFRQRRMQDKPSVLTKFNESGWRCLCYTLMFIFGSVCLWNKPWLWNIRHCWHGYPYHPLTQDMWCYYIMELSFYWSLVFSSVMDIKRKDFWQMFLHHITTICLMSFSWTCNLTRIGTLVLVVHDVADIFLESAKMAKYTHWQRVCDVLFATFTILWIVTRLGIYPVWILYSTSVEAPSIVEMFPAYYIFNGLLLILLVLHCFWTYFILKLAFLAITTGETAGDTRSSSSELVSSEEEIANHVTPNSSSSQNQHMKSN